MTVTLKIYTMKHCPTCEVTRRTAADIAERWPEVHVEIIDLEDPDVEAPPEVFSVPTYMLDEDVVSLGNPFVDQLDEWIRRRLCT